MQRRALQLVAVCCLVALAGCSGALTGGGDASTTQVGESNVTTAVGGDGQTPGAVSYPPGVSEDGTDLAALSANHDETLNGSSFALSIDVTQNTSKTNQSVTLDAAVDADRENVRVNVSGTNQQVETYTTAETRYLRIATDNGTAYRSVERTADATKLVPSSYSGTSYLDRFAERTNASFVPTGTREVNGTTLVVLRADGSNVSVPDANVTDYDATILVDEQGVVHRFEVSLRADRGDVSLRTSVTMTVSGVGETTVTEPAWIDEARNQTDN